MHKPVKALAVSVAAVLALAPMAASAQGACNSPGGATYQLSLTSVPRADLKGKAFRTSLTVNGQPHDVLLDTGSPAVNVPRSLLSNVTVLSTNQQYGYVSSGIYYMGDWVLASVSLTATDEKGKTVTLTTPQMPVFGAIKSCHGKPPNATCKPLAAKDGLGMMGIGYKPYKVPVAQPPAQPLLSTNVLLNLPETKNNSGYVISADSFTVGVPKDSGFKMVPLSGSGDSLAPQGCIAYTAVNGQAGPFCGSLLMDTGINHLYLTMPTAAYCPAGLGRKKVKVTVTAPSGAGAQPALHWVYTTAPRQATSTGAGSSGDNCATEDPAKPATGYHINTGRMLLADYNYLYDATCNAVGFHPVPRR